MSTSTRKQTSWGWYCLGLQPVRPTEKSANSIQALTKIALQLDQSKNAEAHKDSRPQTWMIIGRYDGRPGGVRAGNPVQPAIPLRCISTLGQIILHPGQLEALARKEFESGNFVSTLRTWKSLDGLGFASGGLWVMGRPEPVREL